MAGEMNFGLLNTEASMQAALAPIKGMGAVNALAAQNLQNEASQFEMQNALAEQEAYKRAAQGQGSVSQNLMGAGLGGKAAEYQRKTAEAQKLGWEGKVKQLESHRAEIGMLAADPSDANVMSYLQKKVQSGEVSPEQAMQAWQDTAGLPYDQRKQKFMQQAVSLDTIYKTQADVQQRMQGTVPAGYRMTPAGTLEAIPGGPTTTPLAPKELQKRNADYPAATSAITGYETKADNFVKDLQALRDHPGLADITGIAAGRLPGLSKDGRAAQALYDKIVAKGGFQALQDLRAASKTGGALGNVSNQEGKQLVQSFAAIDRRQDIGDVQAALDQAISDVEGSKTRMREAYDTTYEYRNTTPAAPAGGAGDDNFPPGEIGDAMRKFRQSKKAKSS